MNRILGPDGLHPLMMTDCPRRLRVRVDLEIVERETDEYLSTLVAKDLRTLVGQDWFRDGSYESGHIVHGERCKLRLTFTNEYGPTWYWRLWNRFDWWITGVRSRIQGWFQ